MPAEPVRDLGKLLLLCGIVLVVVGAVLALGPKLPGKLGRLPGDIVVRRETFTLYLPIATSVLLSVVLSVLLWLVRRR